ncbi:glucose-6-phosphate isomerase [Methylophilaceae bacterium]|nr:glucose-6-phosphate isomerase [Methylophilaceae bacterium]
MTSIKNSDAWIALVDHHKSIKSAEMRDLFNEDENRFNDNHIQYDDLLIDFSKNRITKDTIPLLIKLSHEANLNLWRDKLFSGEKINFSENRSALHTALRNRSNTPVLSEGKNVMPEINESIDKMGNFSESVRSGEWKGFTGKRIETIVNIGIGGSDLGPAMVCKALKPYGTKNIIPLFVSNVDGADLAQTLQQCDPETTLFIIASKTFTTQETMTNAFSAREWLISKLKDSAAISRHFVAISTNITAVEDFGIAKNNMFKFWDWVGGRYSLWSSIGLPIAIFIGIDNFKDLLAGAHEIDNHFKTAPPEKNIPVVLALIGIWNINFFNFTTHAILPYDQGLSLLPSYLQQLDMESNGKFIDREGNRICLNTGPILWGESGTNGQHAFYQLLHQGKEIVPTDFLMPIHSQYKIGENGDGHHKILISNFIAQTKSLMLGKTETEARDEMLGKGIPKKDIDLLASHKSFIGNRPSTSILFNKLDPKTLGRIIAIYEHKIFVQGIIWNINSFDQWGVEYGKQIASLVLPELRKKTTTTAFDSSTNNLINYTKKNL